MLITKKSAFAKKSRPRGRHLGTHWARDCSVITGSAREWRAIFVGSKRAHGHLATRTSTRVARARRVYRGVVPPRHVRSHAHPRPRRGARHRRPPRARRGAGRDRRNFGSFAAWIRYGWRFARLPRETRGRAHAARRARVPRRLPRVRRRAVARARASSPASRRFPRAVFARLRRARETATAPSNAFGVSAGRASGDPSAFE